MSQPSNPQSMEVDRSWFEQDLLDRFLRYVRIHTTSDRHSATSPTTERQFELARLLESELKAIGITDVQATDTCYVLARVPGNTPGTPFGLMAHIDTAPDFSGENVKPQVIKGYDGGVITLDDDHELDPEEYPNLLKYQGETVITTDGSTLLGSDDKAGIAEIVTAIRYLLEHPEAPRPDIELAFTPDEETGSGMTDFPLDWIKSRFFFTVDGTDEGAIENECFTAFRVAAKFTGYSIHPGSARGKLANATAMAAMFVSLLPRSESPEATDGSYGFYCPTEITGSIATAEVSLIIRDFDMEIVQRRLHFMETIASTVEGAFPGGSISIETEQQYLNMGDFLSPHPEVTESMAEAIRMTGMEPSVHQIRGGTDGSRLSEKGTPTPNLFTGGQNLHGRYEWIALPAMVRASKTLVNLAQLFAEKSASA